MGTTLEYWELASYVVTACGLPYALWIFWVEKKRQIQVDEEEVYQELSDEYTDFLKLLLTNSDLRLISANVPPEPLTEDQVERKKIIFEILISIFERAFILVHDNLDSAQSKRMWASWDDYISFWCKRPDFRNSLEGLLAGEDPEFSDYLKSKAMLS